MDEKKENTGSTEDTREGDKPKEPDAVIKARAENERLETNLKKKEELIEREEELAAHKEMGGTAEAGSESEKKEETPKEYKDRVLKGDI